VRSAAALGLGRFSASENKPAADQWTSSRILTLLVSVLENDEVPRPIRSAVAQAMGESGNSKHLASSDIRIVVLVAGRSKQSAGQECAGVQHHSERTGCTGISRRHIEIIHQCVGSRCTCYNSYVNAVNLIFNLDDIRENLIEISLLSVCAERDQGKSNN
jgi:hypothetical protein